MIKQFTKGLVYSQELEEDYLDWFFLSHFGKGQGFWKEIPSDKLNSIMEFQHLKEQQFWENWVTLFKKMFK